ncbi:MAG: methyltransferase domain-containing protein [Asgard group archaeon]|nr:methyltransferase domain-containing protein [Asgard group archaeon]
MTDKKLDEKWYFIPASVAFWYYSTGTDFIKKIGIKKGNKVLDFGCNVGDYSIPISHVVGAKGLVYALDKDADAINELEKRMGKLEITNIKLMKTKGELIIDLDTSSLDYIIFYDVIYPLYLEIGIQPFKELLNEFHRILKKNGILSMSIVHEKELPFTFDEIIAETDHYFIPEEKLQEEIMVWHQLRDVEVLQFRKKD